jgi:ribonuclease J
VCARVVTERDARVHGSGHAYRDEMRELIQSLRPLYFIPMHGDLRHLIRHRELAVACGLTDDQVLVIENGTMLEFVEQGVHWTKTDWAGQVLVDGKMMDGVEEVVLRDRQHLAEDGMLTVILVIDRRSHKVIAGPDFVSRGFVVMDDSEALMQSCREVVLRTFEECGPDSQEDWEVVKLAVRKALRKFLREQTDRYPVILPVVVEV